jgi:hypothetical protein
MREAERTPAYRKDPAQERRLRELNTLLAPLEERAISLFREPRLPIVFIVGVPRSGSTLLSQVLARMGVFSYISNFVARFWMAPYVGMLIEDALGIRATGRSLSFDSAFGVTEGWVSPHEFGYFWSRWFHYGETHKLSAEDLAAIDDSTLRKELAALESVHDRPLLFKNTCCGLQAGFLATVLDKSIFVLCYRHPLYNMQSLLLARAEVVGDKRCWWSLRPKEYPELVSLSPYEQVAAQVYYTLKEIEGAASSLPAGRFVRVGYDDLCVHPRATVNKVVEAVRVLGVEVDWEVALIPERFEPADVQRVSGEEFRKLQEAAEKYFVGDEWSLCVDASLAREVDGQW